MFKNAFAIGFVLTAASWALVYVTMAKVPLSGTDMTVVFAFWYGVALLGLWLWKRFRPGAQNAQKKN
jgi:hypothetical protein